MYLELRYQVKIYRKLTIIFIIKKVNRQDPKLKVLIFDKQEGIEGPKLMPCVIVYSTGKQIKNIVPKGEIAHDGHSLMYNNVFKRILMCGLWTSNKPVYYRKGTSWHF